MIRRTFPLSLLTALVLWPSTALAYLDPASGSMLLQLLLGGIAGAAVVVKLYWRRILQRIGVKRDDQDQPSAS